jgi:hypothetical protein
MVAQIPSDAQCSRNLQVDYGMGNVYQSKHTFAAV